VDFILATTISLPTVPASAVATTAIGAALTAVVYLVTDLAKQFISADDPQRTAKVRILAILAAIVTVSFEQFAPGSWITSANEGLALAAASMAAYQIKAPILAKLSPPASSSAEVSTIAAAVDTAIQAAASTPPAADPAPAA
jgi:hypothetical protein